MTRSPLTHPLAVALLLCATTACMRSAGAHQGSAAPASGAFTGESKTAAVSGMYEPLVIDQVDRLAREDGHVVVKGSTGSVPIDLPPQADTSQPTPAWRLVTEGTVGDLRRLTFTHETSLEDFSFLLPASTADLHYGAFRSTEGGSVLVFAWGEDWHCYWGYATIAPKPAG